MDEMIKRNGLTRAQLKEELRLGIRVKKLLEREPQANRKPSEKEIAEFYEKNRDKFKVPEAVHVRHILIAKQKDETEATRAEKIAKIEGGPEETPRRGRFRPACKGKLRLSE